MSERKEFEENIKTMMSETMPVDKDGLKAQWQQIGNENGIDVKTQDIYNPFWRFVTEVVTKPVLWLQNYIAVFVMPNLFLKFATGEYLVHKAWEMAVEPKTKSKAQINITFTRIDASSALTVASGAEINSPSINGVTYKLFTLNDGEFEIGETEIDILCEAEFEGESYNLAAGYYHVIPKTISGVTSVVNKSGSIIKAGTDDETEEELRLRTRDKWDVQFQWHVDTVYKNLVASFDGVSTDNVYFNRASPRAENSADALIMFDVGEPSPSFIQNIDDTIQNNELYGLGDDFKVLAMPTTLHDLVCSYSFKDELSPELKLDVIQNIEDFIRAAFRDNDGGVWNVTRTEPYESFSFGLLTHEIFIEYGAFLKQLRFDNDDIISGLSIPKIQSLVLNEL